MSVRVLDIVLANVNGTGYSDQKLIDRNVTPFYEPNNLGGGYTRDESGNLSLNNEAITMKVICKTDINGTGYEKYMKLVEDISNYSMVWLRYAVPVSNGFEYAYRAGYISGITKTEGFYTDQSLVEQITIQTLSGWFKLYTFSGSNNISLHPSNANNISGSEKYKVYSNYPKNNKKGTYTHPYWYGNVTKEIKRVGNWYNKNVGVLDNRADNYQVFAIHAPSTSINPTEETALSNYQMQISTIKGNSFASNNVSQYDNENAGILKTRQTFNDRRESFSFASRIENYTDVIPVNGPFKGEYTSFLVQGVVYGKGALTISTGSNNIVTNALGFRHSGRFLIDTAPWAYTFMLSSNLNGSTDGWVGTSTGIDFSRFVKTTANITDVMRIENGTINKVIMRRGIVGV